MFDLNTRIQFIREGMVELDGRIEESHVYHMLMKECSQYLIETDLLTETSAIDIIKKAIEFMRKKVIDFFNWLLNKLSLTRGKRSRTMTNAIANYNGNDIVRIPEKLFLLTPDNKALDRRIGEYMTEIGMFARDGLNPEGMNKYVGIAMYMDDLEGLKNKIAADIVTSMYDIDEKNLDSEDLVSEVYGQSIDVNLGTVGGRTVNQKLDHYSLVVETVSTLRTYVNTGLNNFMQTRRLKEQDLRSANKLANLIIVVLDGIIAGLTKVYALVLSAYSTLIRVANTMARVEGA